MGRKLAVLSILLVYLTVTAGFAMNAHFCGSKVSDISFTSAGKPCCDKLAEQMKCCHDKHIDIKISDKHQAVNHTGKFKVLSLMLFNYPVYPYLTIQPAGIKNNFTAYNGPPPLRISLTISNSVFRI